MKKDRISELLYAIRDFVNFSILSSKFQKSNKDWSQACSCMDILDDTYMAIKNYEAFNFGISENTDYFVNKSSSYILIYGILQALILQQDALKFFCEAFQIKGDFLNNKNLQEIRYYRHISTGHPTKKKEGKDNYSFHHISQSTLTENGFQMIFF